ncbi:hypothetical protein FML25_03115 [Klebsiella oxytoca]|uniref:hypothetical protein n=1 Tax=Klebsiella oxytoca TaxID=571 RepID=UPI001CCE5080|nr:hypothetical protein [Klebsiella oxytoca]EKY0602886.1 hypothetical protein [Klebsiella oxytoca]MBZ7065467.1 hypothetical protein [Klebsiella oxytoca]MBZ7686954.1 hypothetical protein [Klebsiella oxytoca]MBZ7759625.1 hypothetical protein [Klebsiella oxytoca]HCQ7059813.1 hypothetical protein [Klebsiella oxytoca]
MIPDYLTFTRYQDKRVIIYLYLLTMFLLFLFWKNNGYNLLPSNVLSLSVILALIVFSFIYELKNYWGYKCVMKHIDFSYFQGKAISSYEAFMWHPAVVTFSYFAMFYLLITSCLSFMSSGHALLCIAIISPLAIYLAFKYARYSYVKRMKDFTAQKVVWRNLHHYVGFNLFITFLMNSLIVSPLANEDDFSLADGFFSARLMIAMFILCVIVLFLDMIFIRPSKRYIFLGRLFLREFDFHLSKSIPWPWLYNKAMWLRLFLVLITQFIWIVLLNVILTFSGLSVYFEFYFLSCSLPSFFYFYLHAYWHWHNDYIVACDMYFRCDRIEC